MIIIIIEYCVQFIHLHTSKGEDTPRKPKAFEGSIIKLHRLAWRPHLYQPITVAPVAFILDNFQSLGWSETGVYIITRHPGNHKKKCAHISP